MKPKLVDTMRHPDKRGWGGLDVEWWAGDHEIVLAVGQAEPDNLYFNGEWCYVMSGTWRSDSTTPVIMICNTRKPPRSMCLMEPEDAVLLATGRGADIWETFLAHTRMLP